jgi:hypothetical protein
MQWPVLEYCEDIGETDEKHNNDQWICWIWNGNSKHSFIP